MASNITLCAICVKHTEGGKKGSKGHEKNSVP